MHDPLGNRSPATTHSPARFESQARPLVGGTCSHSPAAALRIRRVASCIPCHVMFGGRPRRWRGSGRAARRGAPIHQASRIFPRLLPPPVDARSLGLACNRTHAAAAANRRSARRTLCPGRGAADWPRGGACVLPAWQRRSLSLPRCHTSPVGSPAACLLACSLGVPGLPLACLASRAECRMSPSVGHTDSAR